MDIFFGYIGSILGSFLGLVSYRLPRNMELVKDRSRCENCFKELKVYELVPIFSYIRQSGRCTCCGGKIRTENFLIELVNGLIFFIFIKSYGLNLVSLIGLACLELLLIMALIDVEHMIIPNSISLILLTFSIVKSLLLYRFKESFIVSIVFLALVLAGYIISNRGFGMGDIKVFFALSYFWSLDKFLLHIFVSLLLGSFYSIIMILGGRLGRKDRIAFAPFILLGYIVTILMGDYILSAYKLFFYRGW